VISLQGVPSALIARNESWVRQEANRLARHLPSNVEKADLIQAGLIAVAQASLSFEWEGDHDSEEGKQAFVRYARLRVKGAMLDELRQMDHLGRPERRKVKVIQIARERWQASHGSTPSLLELSAACSMSVDEIAHLEQLALQAQSESLTHESDEEMPADRHQPATEADEVEARVDTAIVLRRLEKFFATLPERDRQLIDTYLGVGLSPTALAESWNVTPSRISQLYGAACKRIARHFGHGTATAAERRAIAAAELDRQVEARESQFPEMPAPAAWGALIEHAFETTHEDAEAPIVVGPGTRWG
jgi:RNA polymerase sigma factor for flagellar operon FliA